RRDYLYRIRAAARAAHRQVDPQHRRHQRRGGQGQMRLSQRIAAAGASAVCGLALIGCAAQSARPDNDPLEGMNRKVFWFNDKVDVYVLEPVAKGWDWIAPDQVKQSIANFFQNLRFPIVTLNEVLQGKLKPAASDVGRFAVNTTVGVLGFFD